jgi:hypothetical protein
LSNKRLETNPAARNLRAEAAGDPRFAALQALPEFKTLTAPPQ